MSSLLRRRRIVQCIVVLSAMGVARADAQKRAAPVASCTAPEYRQFDFVVGDWDVYDVGSTTLKARNRVTRMLDGCALREVYERPDGYVGESFSTYNPTRRTWHQSWVTNRGELLLLDGALAGDAMVLSGQDPTSRDALLIRGVWRRQPDGSIRETATQSKDGGKTWSPVFDIVFRRHDGS